MGPSDEPVEYLEGSSYHRDHERNRHLHQRLRAFFTHEPTNCSHQSP